MNQYTVSYCNSAPDWSTIPSLELCHPYRQTPDYIRAFGQFAYDDEALWVHMWIEVPQILAEEKGPYGMPCQDSCLEFFFCPVPDDPRYINIEFNYNCCMFLGIGPNVYDLLRLIPNTEKNPLQPVTRTTDTGWEIFYRIPYSLIRRLFPAFEATPGLTIRANCFTCASHDAVPYYKSWNLVKAEPFTFHHSQSFGFMIFSNQ